jgi:hypothetical protein
VRHGLDRLVRLGNVSHYHVLSEDLDHCPQGAAHKGHCVLLDDKTRCIYVGNPVQHTCCVSSVALLGHADDKTVDGIVMKMEREYVDEDSEEEKYGFATVKVSQSSASQELQMHSSFKEITGPFIPQTPSPNISEPCAVSKAVSFESPDIKSAYPSPPLSTTVNRLFDLSKTSPTSPSSWCQSYHHQQQKRKLQSERQRHHSRRKARSQQLFIVQQSSTMMPGHTPLPAPSSVDSNLWSSSQPRPDSTCSGNLHQSETVRFGPLPVSNGTVDSILALVVVF